MVSRRAWPLHDHADQLGSTAASRHALVGLAAGRVDAENQHMCLLVGRERLAPVEEPLERVCRAGAWADGRRT